MTHNTKQLIWQRTQELMIQGQLFQRLTIQQICSAAAIHRSTFYRLFLDKFNLLEFGIETLW